MTPTREQELFAANLMVERAELKMREDGIAVVTGIYTVHKRRRDVRVHEIYYVDPEGNGSQVVTS